MSIGVDGDIDLDLDGQGDSDLDWQGDSDGQGDDDSDDVKSRVLKAFMMEKQYCLCIVVIPFTMRTVCPVFDFLGNT